jgi:hypothetical protein
MSNLYLKIKGLSANNRILLITRCAVIACGILLMVEGRPPAKAQDAVIPTQRMVSSTDETQDIEIGKLQDFKRNQEAWNAQTGKDVADALATSHATDNKLSGGLTLITIFTLLGIGFQFGGKRKARSE